MKERIRYFDIAKGIAIICVILGHFGIAWINNIVFTFHMPLFFVLSGYFLSDKGTLAEFTKKKAVQLLFPYVFTCVCMTGFAVCYNVYETRSFENVLWIGWNWVKASLYGSGTTGNKVPFEIWQIGAIWFLLALFIALVEVRFFSKVKYGVIWIIAIACIARISEEYIWLPFSIQGGLFAAVFVYCGLLGKKYDIFNKKIPLWIKAIGAVIWVLTMIYLGGFYMVMGRFSHGIFDLFVSLIATYLVVDISKGIERYVNPIAKVFVFYGENSLTVLCAHLFELNVLPWHLLWYQMGEVWHLGFAQQVWIVTILRILWSTVMVLIVNRIPILYDIFHGAGIKRLFRR